MPGLWWSREEMPHGGGWEKRAGFPGLKWVLPRPLPAAFKGTGFQGSCGRQGPTSWVGKTFAGGMPEGARVPVDEVTLSGGSSAQTAFHVELGVDAHPRKVLRPPLKAAGGGMGDPW